MTSKPFITAVVPAYNESAMLAQSLPILKACVDQVVVVDMQSTDDSAALFDRHLDGRDMIVSYPRENLFAYGFSHPRNFGAKFALGQWILAIDADEVIDTDHLDRWRSDVTPDARTLHIDRRTYKTSADDTLDRYRDAIQSAPFTIDNPCRLYLNLPEIRFEGIIHEEVWDGPNVSPMVGHVVDITLHHLNELKPKDISFGKLYLYYYLTLKAVAFPGFRFGTNKYWFDEFPRPRLEQMIAMAEEFCKEHGLPVLPEHEIRKNLA